MKMKKISSSQLRRGMIEGYRSGLECSVGAQLNSANVRWEYESERIPYTPRSRTYTPDFIDPKGKWIIETKGYANESFPLRWKLFKKHLKDNGHQYVLLCQGIRSK